MAGGGCEAVGVDCGLGGGQGAWDGGVQLVGVRCCPKKGNGIYGNGFFVREASYNYRDSLRPWAGFTLFLYPFLTPLNA